MSDEQQNLYKDSDVIVLTDEDFIISEKPRIRSSVWEKGDNGYLMAYASWCPHCRNKVDMWKNLAKSLHEIYPEERFLVVASNIDSDIPKLSQKAGIKSIPTLFRILEDGSLEKKETDWSLDDLMQY